MKKKNPTSQDVAKLAGVSCTTVSLVLNKVPGAQISDKQRKQSGQLPKSLTIIPMLWRGV